MVGLVTPKWRLPKEEEEVSINAANEAFLISLMFITETWCYKMSARMVTEKKNCFVDCLKVRMTTEHRSHKSSSAKI